MNEDKPASRNGVSEPPPPLPEKAGAHPLAAAGVFLMLRREMEQLFDNVVSGHARRAGGSIASRDLVTMSEITAAA